MSESVKVKKVVVLTSSSPSLLNFRKNLMEKMTSAGHNIIVIAPSYTATTLEKLETMGVQTEKLRFENTGFNPLNDLIFVFSLFRLLRQLKPDVFFSYGIKSVFYGGLAARIANVSKIVVMITGLGFSIIEQSIKGRVARLVLRVLSRMSLPYCSTVVFQNPDDPKALIETKILSPKVSYELVNGSGVDLDEFSPTPLPEKISFLMLSRLLKHKGVVEYLEAAKKIKAKYSDVNFILAGDYSPNPAAISKEQFATMLDDGAVNYLGSLDDVKEAIANCSVYVLPSYREGTPRSVLEAMSMGRAIITTDAPGCRETVKNNVNGYLVPVGAVGELAQAMELFINDKANIISMGANSRKIAEKKYDVNVVSKNMMKFMGL